MLTITYRSLSWPQGYKAWVHSQTQNKAQWLADCGHVSAISQSLRFILSLRMNSSFITSRPVLIFVLRCTHAIYAITKLVNWDSSHELNKKISLLSFSPTSSSSNIVHEKWVWSGNTAISLCRPTYSTVRNGHITFTVTRHSKDNKRKATFSLFLVKTIEKLKGHKVMHFNGPNKDQNRTPTNNGRYIKQ